MDPNTTLLSFAYQCDASNAWWLLTFSAHADFPSAKDPMNCGHVKSRLQKRFSPIGRVGRVLQDVKLINNRTSYAWSAQFLPPSGAQLELIPIKEQVSSRTILNKDFQIPSNLSPKAKGSLCAWIRKTVKCAAQKSSKVICFLPSTELDVPKPDPEETKTESIDAISSRYHFSSDGDAIAQAKQSMPNSDKPKPLPLLTSTQPDIGKRPVASEKEERTQHANQVESRARSVINNAPPQHRFMRAYGAVAPPAYSSETEFQRVVNDLDTLSALGKFYNCAGADASILLGAMETLEKKGLLHLTPPTMHKLYEYGIAHTNIPIQLIVNYTIRPSKCGQMSDPQILHNMCRHWTMKKPLATKVIKKRLM